MRMRQRRIDRLLLKADAALDSGAIDDAREALEEIERLDTSAAGVSERRLRLQTAIADPPILDPPDTVAAPALLDLDLELRSPVEMVPERRRAYVWLGRVAAALLVLGAIAWFAIPRYLSQPVVGVMSTTSTAEPGVDAAQPDAGRPASLPPVQVAFDEVAPASTVAEPLASEPLPAALPTAGTDVPPVTRADDPVSARSEPIAEAAPPPAPERGAPLPAASEPRMTTPPPPVPVASTALDRSAVSSLPTTPTPVQPSVALLPDATPPEPIAAPPREAPSDVNVARKSDVASDVKPPPGGTAPDEALIRSVLMQYESAYSRLDANAAGGVFPGLDRRALARAFDGLSAQQVNLGSCDVRVMGEAAIAECSGSATWTPKVGGGTHNQRRRWQFRMRNLGGEWKIIGANVR